MDSWSRNRIGASLMDSAPLTTDHPLYTAIAEQAALQLKQISKQVDARRRTTKKMLVMVALDPEESSVLKLMFPEFNGIDYGVRKPGHSLFHAMRDFSNEWCVSQVSRYASSIAHIGGTASLHLQSARQSVHILGDCSDEVYAHALHESVLDATRLTRDVATVSRQLNRVIAPAGLMRFLKAECLVPCKNGGSCFHFQDSLVVDGSMVAMSPHQVAAAMLQMKSTVAFGFFPYCPAMLVSDTGNLDRSGITFSRVGAAENSVFLFQYPEGRCGVDNYPVTVWASWVREQTITLEGVAGDNHFQLELLKNRGPFMFYRMVKVDSPIPATRLIHALDLPQNADVYTVMSWRLKYVGSDPRSESSWERFSFTAEVRLVDQVYNYGMQLEAKSFTRFAIRKQLKVVNDRVVINGTAVTWHAPLSPDEIDQLSVAIFSRLFVDRYDAGKLSSELIAKLKTHAFFHEASVARKISFIASLALNNLWDSTLIRLDDKVRDVCDTFDRFVNGNKTGKDISIYRPPLYVKMESVARTWFDMKLPNVVIRPSYPKSYVIGSVPGVFCTPKGEFPCGALGNDVVYSDTIDVPGKLIVAVDANKVNDIDFTTREVDSLRQETASLVASLNAMDFEPIDRHSDLSVTVKRVDTFKPSKPDFDVDPDPIHTFNTVYDNCFPGNSAICSQRDVGSNVLDPQDRNFAAVYMSMGYDMQVPKSQRVYKSKIKALNVTKRPDTLSELLSATVARNTGPPVVSKPQNYDAVIHDVWENFKKTACVDNVENLLAKFQDDPTALGEKAYHDWMGQAKNPQVIERVKAAMEREAKSMEEYNVGDYIVMIKSDVKVPLSTKIQHERTEPQVIVYHDKVLSACYSSIFRVLVTRFLAILRPNIHVNLRKDTKDIAGFIGALHPFDLDDTGQPLTYLENDFSKYDKSQLELAFLLEKFVFEKLGMNKYFVDTWFLGHMDCKLRSLVHAFTLRVSWQRKSGDATTAFGNVLLNCMSVLYAYPISKIYWMVFMGDDSIVCADRVATYDQAVIKLAEVFNLQAKTYVTTAPYFASNFIVINKALRTVGLLPDPIKRIERWSMSVCVTNADFDDKFRSAADVCELYKYKAYTEPLKLLVPERYQISTGDTQALSSATATCISDKTQFTSIWHDFDEIEDA